MHAEKSNYELNAIFVIIVVVVIHEIHVPNNPMFASVLTSPLIRLSDFAFYMYTCNTSRFTFHNF